VICAALCSLAAFCVAQGPRKASRPAAKSAASPAAKPNILLVTIDTLRPDHLGCYGYKQIRTPNLDALAREGVLFRQAYTSVPITLPSHAALLTGTFPTFNGMHDFSGNRLGNNQPTLATVLKASGYSTGAVVASAVLDSRFGLNRGFDSYYDNFDFSRVLETNLDAMERPANQVIDHALQWLAAADSHKPFFLWVHLYDPHYPYTPPAPFAAEYRERPYDGEIAFADSQLGRLFDRLRRGGQLEKMLVVVSGDHGEGLGEHGEKTHGFFVYDSTLHVPLLIKLPGSHSVRQVEAPVNLVDVMPTVLRAAGIAVPAQVQGKNLAALLRGQKEIPASPLYAETYLPRLHFDWSELRSLQAGGYHFIDSSKPELYEVGSDPGETRNLFAERPAMGSELQRKLAEVIRQYTPQQAQAQKTGLDEALAERLKSLGYAVLEGGGDVTVSNRDLPAPKDRLAAYDLISAAIDDSQHGRYDDSIGKLDEALKIEPNSLPVHFLRGQNYMRKHDLPAAIAEFELLLKLSPTYAVAAYQLGIAQGQSGDFQTAAATLKRALELDPANAMAAYNLGAAYFELKQVPQSIAAFQQCVAISPANANCHRSLGEMLQYGGRIDEAGPELQKAVELAPEDPRTHVALARFYQAKGLAPEAREEMRKAAAAQQHP
jgi:arylsulfatase A-like enzyme/Tfp pilus assembly protein PilF